MVSMGSQLKSLYFIFIGENNHVILFVAGES